MLTSLTTKQKKVLTYYHDYIASQGEPPTYQQAADDLQVSPSVVHNHVKNLEKLWYVVKEINSWSVWLTSAVSRVPLVWSVACGEPIDVYEEVWDYIDVPTSTLGWWHTFYALRAKWKSMINVGISDNDILIIRKQEVVNDGDIAVVVLWDGSQEAATLKRVFRKPLSILLKAENDDFPNTVITDQNVQIRWKLINVIRNL